MEDNAQSPPGHGDDEDDLDPPSSLGPTPVHGDPERPAVETVTALQLTGTNVQLGLSPLVSQFRFGAGGEPEVDVTLECDGVSRVHALLVRKGPKLRVLDQRSTNGTFFAGKTDPDFEVAPGDAFFVSQRHKLLVLDEHMRLLRRTLQWFLGLRDYARVDRALEGIAQNGPVLLLGAEACDQELLAEAIHRHSPFRGRDRVVLDPYGPDEAHRARLAHAAGGSAFLDLRGCETPLTAARSASLFAGTTRPIIAAWNEEAAMELLQIRIKDCAIVEIPRLSQRTDDLPRLLAALISQRAVQKSAPALPLVALGAENIEGLKRYPWPKNFRDLRKAVPRLHAVLAHGLRLRPAARYLGKAPTTLRENLDVINVHIGRDTDEIDEELADALLRGDDRPMPESRDDDDELPEPPLSGRPTGDESDR